MTSFSRSIYYTPHNCNCYIFIHCKKTVLPAVNKSMNIKTNSSTSRTANKFYSSRSFPTFLKNVDSSNNFVFRRGRKTNSNCISNSFIEKCWKCNAWFHNPTNKGACFCNPQMKRITIFLSIKAITLYSFVNIWRLHTNYILIKFQIFKYFCLTGCCFTESLSSCNWTWSYLLLQVFWKTATVYSYSDCDTIFTTSLDYSTDVFKRTNISWVYTNSSNISFKTF